MAQRYPACRGVVWWWRCPSRSRARLRVRPYWFCGGVPVWFPFARLWGSLQVASSSRLHGRRCRSQAGNELLSGF